MVPFLLKQIDKQSKQKASPGLQGWFFSSGAICLIKNLIFSFLLISFNSLLTDYQTGFYRSKKIVPIF